MKVGIVGLGLIGGSVATSLKNRGFCSEVIGIDHNEENAIKALQIGFIDKIGALPNAMEEVDILVLAIPVDATRAILPKLLDQANDSLIITDMGSTKAGICETIAQHPKRNQFVAAHPMAGTENSGPEAALDNLFDDKITVLCEIEKSSPEALKTVEALFHCLNMKIIRMDAEEHDRHVSYVSHISHISSFVLGKTVLEIEKDETNIFNMAGSGFASTVRLAKSSPQMWAPIFEQNAKHLSNALDTYINNLVEFKTLIENKDREKLIELMTKVNDIRRVLEGIQLNEEMKNQSGNDSNSSFGYGE